MSGRVYTISSIQFSLAAVAGRHVLTCMASSEQPFKIRRIWLTSDELTGEVVEVVVFRITADGTGGDVIVPSPVNQNDVAFGGIAESNQDSVDPTTGVVLFRGLWNMAVPFELVYAPDEEPDIPGATNEGFSVEIVDTVTQDFVVGATIEEN